jgi:transcriptional regulator with XRE-family HTH domain
MNSLSDAPAVELDVVSEGGDNFGETLRQLRLRARLTQESLAEQAGLSVRTISGLENGRIEHPRDSSVRCLAEALRLDEGERCRFTTLSRHAYWTSRLMTARPGAAAQCLAGSGLRLRCCCCPIEH